MEIKLTQGKSAIVDNEDFKWLNQWKWHYRKGYAISTIYTGMVNGKVTTKKILMHKLINNTPNGMDTDHINQNKLDNRRKNLRIVTRSQNAINSKLSKRNTSGYKGVIWSKKTKKWEARLIKNYKMFFLGYYFTIQGAWLARRWGERAYHDRKEA